MTSSPMQLAQNATQAASRLLRGEVVQVVSGANSVSVTNAVRGETTWETSDVETGVTIESRSVDWMILRSTLTAAGITQPVSGMTITDANGQKHVALPFGDAQTVWRWHDRGGKTTYRIHTKERS